MIWDGLREHTKTQTCSGRTVRGTDGAAGQRESESTERRQTGRVPKQQTTNWVVLSHTSHTNGPFALFPITWPRGGRSRGDSDTPEGSQSERLHRGARQADEPARSAEASRSLGSLFRTPRLTWRNPKGSFFFVVLRNFFVFYRWQPSSGSSQV